MLPVFPIKLVLLALPVVIIVAVVLGLAAPKGGGLKNQAVAWSFTAFMVVAAVFIGIGRSPLNNPSPEAVPAPTAAPPQASNAQQGPGVVPISLYVRDDAGVLSNQTEETLNERNQRLYEQYGVVIGVVTCNYSGDDLGSFAMKYADDMGLAVCDFIVVLDVSGDNYWLVQGADLVQDFTDADCSDYAYDYMEEPFARGDYDAAVLQLTERLETWYGVYYWLD